MRADIIALIQQHARELTSDKTSNQPHHITLLDALIKIAKDDQQ